MVGATGLEPAASWSRTKHATKLRYAPTLFYIILFMTGCQGYNSDLKFFGVVDSTLQKSCYDSTNSIIIQSIDDI